MVLFMSIVISIFTIEPPTCLPILVFGILARILVGSTLDIFKGNKKQKLGVIPQCEFAFSTFFPEFVRPSIDSIALVFDQMLCGRNEASIEARSSIVVGTALLPGSDPIEASRRRFCHSLVVSRDGCKVFLSQGMF